MRVILIVVGRLKAGPERELFDRYAGRAQALARGLGMTGVTTRELEESRARSGAERKRDEARAIQAEIPTGSRVVVLDERGRAIGSEAFAGEIGRARDGGIPALALVIGGPDGLADEIRDAASLLVAYGAATFPHQIVRVLAAEQVYRAFTILARHPYHRA